jgi:hypothetical protein
MLLSILSVGIIPSFNSPVHSSRFMPYFMVVFSLGEWWIGYGFVFPERDWVCEG